MRVIKIEYRKIRPDDGIDIWHGMNQMKFHMVVEVDGQKFEYREYVPDFVPYKELVYIAKKSLGILIMDTLL